MTTCPAGHDSASTDYCDKCGMPLTGAAPGGTGPSGPNGPPGPPGTPEQNGPPPGVAGVPTEDMPTPAPPAEQTGGQCPDCGAARTGRFCEECGYDYITGRSINLKPRQPAQPVRQEPKPYEVPAGVWAAVVTADPEYHASVLAQLAPDAPPVPFPPYHPTRQILLTGREVRIGRRSVSRGVTPEIDLGEKPEDPGVSHIHAVLLSRPDGSWVLVDPGSTNGTTVNSGSEPIAYNTEVPLTDGDRVHVGAWTTITLVRGPRGGRGEGSGPR